MSIGELDKPADRVALLTLAMVCSVCADDKVVGAEETAEDVNPIITTMETAHFNKHYTLKVKM